MNRRGSHDSDATGGCARCPGAQPNTRALNQHQNRNVSGGHPQRLPESELPAPPEHAYERCMGDAEGPDDDANGSHGDKQVDT